MIGLRWQQLALFLVFAMATTTSATTMRNIMYLTGYDTSIIA